MGIDLQEVSYTYQAGTPFEGVRFWCGFGDC